MQTIRTSGRRHPQHDQIHETIRSWFRRPMDAMGLRAVVRRWGTYWAHGDVYPSGLLAAELPAFLADLHRFYTDHKSVQVVIDKADIGSKLDVALVGAGWARQVDTAFLVHTGVFPGGSGIPNLVTEPVTNQNVVECARVQVLAFSKLVDEPPIDEPLIESPTGEGPTGGRSIDGQSAEIGGKNASSAAPDLSPQDGNSTLVQIEEKAARLQTELVGNGSGLLASIGGEAVGMLWAYEEAQDIWVSRVGVREPFRGQGIARALLKHRVASAYSHGYRSVVINVRVDNAESLQLYRRLGFRDEVCRQRRYRIHLGSKQHIGKLSIPDATLNLPRTCSPEIGF